LLVQKEQLRANGPDGYSAESEMRPYHKRLITGDGGQPTIDNIKIAV
jgi:hypothetical protein